MKATDLKIGDTFKKQGFKYIVAKITKEKYLNENDSLMIECILDNLKFNPKKLIDSVFHFKPETKI
jgi:hypothetical protein